MSINIGRTETRARCRRRNTEGRRLHCRSRYCFYFNGWQGPGWYRCGFAWRRNLGWGGEYGW
jgi:hypothetical protein